MNKSSMVGDLFNFIKGKKPELDMKEGKVPDVGKDSDEEIVKKLQEDIAVTGQVTPEIVASLKEQMPDDFGSADQDQLVMGIEVELEHGTRSPSTDITGDDLIMTAKIAMAHLNEIPDYYTRLAMMEQQAKEEMGAEKEEIVDEIPPTDPVFSPQTEMPESKNRRRVIKERNWKYKLDLSVLAPSLHGDRTIDDADVPELGKKVVVALQAFAKAHPELADELESDIEEFGIVSDIEGFDAALDSLYSLGDNLTDGIWINTMASSAPSEAKVKEAKRKDIEIAIASARDSLKKHKESKNKKGEEKAAEEVRRLSKMLEQVTGIPPKVLSPAGRVVGQVGGEFDDKVVNKEVVTIARGISDEGVAKDIAAKNNGQVLQDVNDDTKFMVVAGIVETKIKEKINKKEVRDYYLDRVEDGEGKQVAKEKTAKKFNMAVGDFDDIIADSKTKESIAPRDEEIGRMLDEFEAWRAETHKEENISNALKFIEEKYPDIEWDKEKAFYDTFKGYFDKHVKEYESKINTLAEKLLLADVIENKKTPSSAELKFLEETKKIELSEKERKDVKKAYDKLKGKKSSKKQVGAGYAKAY